MIYHDLIIIGGGASGLMAAINAKDLGIDVAIVEGGDRIGRKILATGNGRCNISNRGIKPPFANYHSENEGFFTDALSTFANQEAESLFLSLGLPIVERQNKKVYPRSLQASSVVDIFRLALEDRNIPLYTECKVKTIHKKENFILSTSNDEYNLFTCKKLLLCCGGKSAVKTGSDGSMHNIVKSLGHKITATMPGIVQLRLDNPYLKSIAGVKFDGYATLIVNDEEIKTEFGEILFTDYGISGPPIFILSSYASRHLHKNSKVEIVVDMMPTYTKEDVENFIEGHFAILSHRPAIDSLIGVINKKLIPALLKSSGVTDLHVPCYDLDWKVKANIMNNLKKWKFTCIDTNGFTNAQVTIGGVDTKDVNPKTLESKLVNGLYFAGEILDVDGDCGGFNLQWAWTSGYFAAHNIAKSLGK